MNNYLSPLYKVLILLEDKRNASFSEIQKYGVTASRGVLGKMEAMKLIKKTNYSGDVYFSLSDNGYDFLNNILNKLHQSIIHWDGKWRIVWFSIAEKERSKRDRFRRYLEFLGLKPILKSVWITPLNLNKEILEGANKFNVYEKILFTEVEKFDGINQEDILKAWDFKVYHLQYENFISKSEEVIINHKNVSRIILKSLVFEYARILNNEPKLPIELLPKDWPRFRAHLQYKRLRRLVTN